MILVWNPGSSSLKYKLFDTKKKKVFVIKSGHVKRIGGDVKNHASACELLISEVRDYLDKVKKVGIRIVHNGGEVKDGEKITPAILKKLSAVSGIAPLHNPKAIETLKTSMKEMKNVAHEVYFDTTYFDNLPEESKVIPLPDEILKKYKIIRYGFHGISHRFAYAEADLNKTDKTVSIHLGSGCSITAICDRLPIETSMSFTPLDGLIMESRPGSIDPGIVLFLANKIGLKKTETILNNDSGLSALTDSKGNMLDVLYLAGQKIEDASFAPPSTLIKNEKTFKKATLGLSVYIRQIQKYIGGYASLMGGLDAVIFTGAIGAGSTVIRQMVMENLKHLKIKKIEVVKPDEELAIAKMMVKIN